MGRTVHPIIAELEAIRRRQGTSIDLAAGFAGLCRQTVWQIETGRRGALLDSVSRYAAALGYRLDLVPINQTGPRP
jgi:DNA-binding XRE family transcriptional regulator